MGPLARRVREEAGAGPRSLAGHVRVRDRDVLRAVPAGDRQVLRGRAGERRSPSSRRRPSGRRRWWTEEQEIAPRHPPVAEGRFLTRVPTGEPPRTDRDRPDGEFTDPMTVLSVLLPGRSLNMGGWAGVSGRGARR